MIHLAPQNLRVELLSDNKGVFGVGTVERGVEKICLITRNSIEKLEQKNGRKDKPRLD
jgi:hypothetical protein